MEHKLEISYDKSKDFSFYSLSPAYMKYEFIYGHKEANCGVFSRELTTSIHPKSATFSIVL